MRIFNHFNQIKHVGSVTLNIGANEVSDEDWEQVNTHPIVRDWIKSGKVEIEKGDLEDITKITPMDKAIEVIESTFDKAKLEKWLKDAERKGVKEAIEKQIEYLEKKPEGNEE